MDRSYIRYSMTAIASVVAVQMLILLLTHGASAMRTEDESEAGSIFSSTHRLRQLMDFEVDSIRLVREHIAEQRSKLEYIKA